MNFLRIVLVVLATFILAAIGWRLAHVPRPTSPEVASMPATSPESTVAPTPPAPIPTVPARPAPTQQSAATPDISPPTSSPAQPAETTAATATAPDPATTAVSDAQRGRVEKAMQDAAELTPTFDRIKNAFPAVAQRAVDGAAAKLKADTDRPSPDDVFANAVRDLRQSSGVLAAKAGPDSLGAIFDKQSAMLAELSQTDPHLCADYLYGGTSPAYADFAAGHRALVAQAAEATLGAILDGRKQQIDHGTPSPDDFKLVEDGLTAKGLSADEISALLDGKSLDPPLPDDRLCGNARTYLSVLHDLPLDPRLRVYGLAAELLARS
ncbi:hypothetical protein LGH83_05510 [Lichenihabitans sp. PAMC28606]|uniref:hypothetical protein n=1 Tax=Lichenihabitans sp. PAMC28606 TaxID=2880932 RepID=UPI001D09BC94|nr:hypothetical protein [Lichenihabitans sp. PAMC28606]UDL95670.1 hypothetical protein LGH83_05510 [Lichenihabitans sp. PAMC28606]